MKMPIWGVSEIIIIIEILKKGVSGKSCDLFTRVPSVVIGA
jgi:hypothetical protein